MTLNEYITQLAQRQAQFNDPIMQQGLSDMPQNRQKVLEAQVTSLKARIKQLEEGKLRTQAEVDNGV